MLPLATQPFHLLHPLARIPHRYRLGADPRLHLLADQTRRYRVHVRFHPDRAATTDPNPHAFLRLQTRRRQGTQLAQLLTHRLATTRVTLRHHRQHELPVRFPAREVAAATQHQRLVQRLLETPMALLAVAVLVAAGRVGRLGHQAIVVQ
jgi:hypothetical protein